LKESSAYDLIRNVAFIGNVLHSETN